MTRAALARAHDRRRADSTTADARSRIYDTRSGVCCVRLLPGEFYTTDAADETIVTVLGSCVAACVRNPRTGFGGMNHFMLPESRSGDWNGVSAAMRYGNHAMEALINAVFKSGCSRQELEIKLFGAANLMTGPSTVARQNADFARRYLDVEGLNLVAADLGGPFGRRIHYVPSTGKVHRRLLKHSSDVAIVEEERRYIAELRRKPIEGTVDLF
jgi:chemotaxis protein CheD